MQPNQQDQNQPSISPSSASGEQLQNAQPYKVPDYLNLDPVTGHQKKPSKKWRPLLMCVIGVMLLAGIGAAVVIWLRDAPQRQFEQAVNNSLQSPYVERTFTFQPKSKSTKLSITATAQTDLSDTSQPKSHVTYSVYDPDPVGATALNSYRKGEIVVGQNHYAGLLTANPPRDLSTQIKFGQWYSYSDPRFLAVLPFDRQNLISIFNTVKGFVPTGAFDSNQRQKIHDFANANSTYTIVSSSADVLKNEKVTHFTLDVSDTQLKSLNEEIASLITLKSTTSPLKADKNQIEVWIDDQSSKIVRTTWLVTRGTDVWTADLTTTYIGKPTINIPTNAIALP